MSDSRPPNPGQVAPDLPGVTHYLTGHDEVTGKAIIHSVRPGNWTGLLDNTLGLNVVYTTSQFPVSLDEDIDIKTHDDLIAGGALGLTNPLGTVARMADFAPGSTALMHRTQSIDYGVVIEGTIELLLDSGESKPLRRGDVVVQRATMHGWKNPSETEWARVFFVLQHCAEVHVAGKVYKEDLGHGAGIIPSSGGDEGEGAEAKSKSGDEK
jgi:hypothetical protein